MLSNAIESADLRALLGRMSPEQAVEFARWCASRVHAFDVVSLRDEAARQAVSACRAQRLGNHAYVIKAALAAADAVYAAAEAYNGDPAPQERERALQISVCMRIIAAGVETETETETD